jgi:hypothetical protein
MASSGSVTAATKPRAAQELGSMALTICAWAKTNRSYANRMPTAMTR